MPQRNHNNMKTEAITETVKATPAVVASTGTVILGLPLSEWAVIATISYVALQAAYLAWKWRQEAKTKMGNT